ncbi:hypothetical protein CEP51_002204 [Fusarium floridanum]|uniref:Uncharacterized protein n=1 Tax=Fusarium floridanum TaxID=1325733 RepID=A0A428SCN8_9HYPO|nr:hypothetical protein CEP51_002204 [Fusarium floridanum]
MSDELAYSRWECSSHAGRWYGWYWYCQEEGCPYQGSWVLRQVASPQADDATGYNGDDPNAEFVADEENDWNNAAAGYGEGRPGNPQPSNQQGQGLYPNGVQQSLTHWHNANEQHDGQEHGDQYGARYDHDQQNDARQHDAHQSGGFHQNFQSPNSPSDAWATMGSRSTADQTNSLASTETLDIDADRDRTRWYVEDQTAVGMNARNHQDMVIQAVGQFVDSPPEYRHGDTPNQGGLYPPELSLSDGSESSVDQSSVERPVLRRRR